MKDTTQSPMTLETMTELVECNTQLHKTLQGLWSDALTQHKLQQHESLIIVHPLNLRVALSYDSRFVLLYSAIRSSLYAEHPATPNDLSALEVWHNFIHPHVLKCMLLCVTSHLPVHCIRKKSIYLGLA